MPKDISLRYSKFVSGSYFTCDCGNQIHPNEEYWSRRSTTKNDIDICQECFDEEAKERS